MICASLNSANWSVIVTGLERYTVISISSCPYSEVTESEVIKEAPSPFLLWGWIVTWMRPLSLLIIKCIECGFVTGDQNELKSALLRKWEAFQCVINIPIIIMGKHVFFILFPLYKNLLLILNNQHSLVHDHQCICHSSFKYIINRTSSATIGQLSLRYSMLLILTYLASLVWQQSLQYPVLKHSHPWPFPLHEAGFLMQNCHVQGGWMVLTSAMGG